MNNQLKREKIYSGECQLKYLLIEHEGSKELLVVFSGFPAENETAKYNYVLQLRDLKCNRLYILDDVGSDPRGTYYLGENKNLFIERTVTELIDKVSSELGVSKKDISTTGSSKGGFASLYYAFKNGYGTAIAGAPQILLGEYLSFHARRNIMTYISGNDNEEDVDYLNGLLTDVILNSDYAPNIYIHVSKNEPHYEDHFKPLVHLLDKKGYKYDVDLATYTDHGQVGSHLPLYVKRVLSNKLAGGVK